MRRFALALLAILIAAILVTKAAAQVVCPDSSSCTATFSCRYSGLYQNGQPFDRVLIVPDSSGETLRSVGITILVVLRDCEGQPLAGIPAENIVLSNPGLCNCAGHNHADAPTDAGGSTTFTGAIRGGGCAEYLLVKVGGVTVGQVPVRTRSPEGEPQSPCHIDASDESFWFRLGTKVGDAGTFGYSICYDLNADGYLDLSDAALFTNYLGAGCSP